MGSLQVDIYRRGHKASNISAIEQQDLRPMLWLTLAEVSTSKELDTITFL
jgi:hypothetical protein